MYHIHEILFVQSLNKNGTGQNKRRRPCMVLGTWNITSLTGKEVEIMEDMENILRIEWEEHISGVARRREKDTKS